MTRTPDVSLDFKKLTIPQKIVFGANVCGLLTTNHLTFPTPDIAVVTLTGFNTDLDNAAIAAAGGDHQKVADMHAKEKIWDNNFGAEAMYVDRIAHGVEATILLSGYKPTTSETTPSTIPDVPVIKIVSANPIAGSVHVEIEVDHNVKAFLFFASSNEDPIVISNNQINITSNPHLAAVIIDTHRKIDFYNLASRADIDISVAAMNQVGISAPCAPVHIKTL